LEGSLFSPKNQFSISSSWLVSEAGSWFPEFSEVPVPKITDEMISKVEIWKEGDFDFLLCSLLILSQLLIS